MREIYASSNDEELKAILNCRVSDREAKRLVESKKDVVLLMDSITRLSRAYNANSGKAVGR